MCGWGIGITFSLRGDNLQTTGTFRFTHLKPCLRTTAAVGHKVIFGQAHGRAEDHLLCQRKTHRRAKWNVGWITEADGKVTTSMRLSLGAIENVRPKNDISRQFQQQKMGQVSHGH